MGSRVTIIGGGGLVGSCAAFSIQNSGVASEIVLLDVNRELAEGQALDMLHSAPLLADQVIRAGDYSDISQSDIVCITAGLRRKPDETRTALINRNAELFVSILDQIQSVGLKSDAIVFVVSNPVDLLTRLAAQRLGLPANQVIGLGTQLDTIRFRSLIASTLQVSPSQLSALILGEHGETMVPIWSAATLGGLPLDKHAQWNPASANMLFERTRKSGAEVISKKGGAGFAVGVAISDVVDSVLLDSRRLLPVSSVQQGKCWGVRDVAISVPTVVGRCGVVDCQPFELWPKEENGIRASASALAQNWQLIQSYA